MEYSKTYTKKVLTNVFSSRSRMLHQGMSFPPYSLEGVSFKPSFGLFDLDRDFYINNEPHNIKRARAYTFFFCLRRGFVYFFGK